MAEPARARRGRRDPGRGWALRAFIKTPAPLPHPSSPPAPVPGPAQFFVPHPLPEFFFLLLAGPGNIIRMGLYRMGVVLFIFADLRHGFYTIVSNEGFLFKIGLLRHAGTPRPPPRAASSLQPVLHHAGVVSAQIFDR